MARVGPQRHKKNEDEWLFRLLWIIAEVFGLSSIIGLLATHL